MRQGTLLPSRRTRCFLKTRGLSQLRCEQCPEDLSEFFHHLRTLLAFLRDQQLQWHIKEERHLLDKSKTNMTPMLNLTQIGSRHTELLRSLLLRQPIDSTQRLHQYSNVNNHPFHGIRPISFGHNRPKTELQGSWKRHIATQAFLVLGRSRYMQSRPSGTNQPSTRRICSNTRTQEAFLYLFQSILARLTALAARPFAIWYVYPYDRISRLQWPGEWAVPGLRRLE